MIAVLHFRHATGEFRPKQVEWAEAYAAALSLPLGRFLAEREHAEGWSESLPTAGEAPEIIGTSPATKRLIALLNMYLPGTLSAESPAILVLGESGTGKELVARYIHRHSSKRRRGPLQVFNCAGLKGELAESRLFGHAKGAFTGAVADAPGLFRAADRGVLFLDEVGELPAEGQALLLRVLETRTVQPVGDTREIPVDVQLILATNKNLRAEVEAKRFREDLYYRISGLRVELTPLRHPSRLPDIRPLLAFYLARHEQLLGKKTMGLTPEAYRALVRYAWPGNVRELNNVCTCLATHAAPGAWIGLDEIQIERPEIVDGPLNPYPDANLEDETATYPESMHAFRSRLVLDRLRRHGGSAVRAASSLGISEPTFYRYWAEARRTVRR
jgi:transcriptional regulator with GAF, ATPase, and Fis domain